MSQAELHVLPACMRGGLIRKARRGELKTPLPAGFVYGPGDVLLTPDHAFPHMALANPTVEGHRIRHGHRSLGYCRSIVGPNSGGRSSEMGGESWQQTRARCRHRLDEEWK